MANKNIKITIELNEEIINAAACRQWHRGQGDHEEGVTFDDLTQKTKTDIWQAYLKQVTIGAAFDRYKDEAAAEAAETAKEKIEQLID